MEEQGSESSPSPSADDREKRCGLPRKPDWPPPWPSLNPGGAEIELAGSKLSLRLSEDPPLDEEVVEAADSIMTPPLVSCCTMRSHRAWFEMKWCSMEVERREFMRRCHSSNRGATTPR